jgi:hypothetical protein
MKAKNLIKERNKDEIKSWILTLGAGGFSQSWEVLQVGMKRNICHCIAEKPAEILRLVSASLPIGNWIELLNPDREDMSSKNPYAAELGVLTKSQVFLQW